MLIPFICFELPTQVTYGDKITLDHQEQWQGGIPCTCPGLVEGQLVSSVFHEDLDPSVDLGLKSLKFRIQGLLGFRVNPQSPQM